MNSSDEAVEALARMLSTHERSWQWDHVSHEGDRQFWRGEAREAMDELRPLIAAAVRAEAVADALRSAADDLYSDNGPGNMLSTATWLRARAARADPVGDSGGVQDHVTGVPTIRKISKETGND